MSSNRITPENAKSLVQEALTEQGMNPLKAAAEANLALIRIIPDYFDLGTYDLQGVNELVDSLKQKEVN